MKQTVLRSLPALCALMIALWAVAISAAGMVGVSYHPQAPYAHLIPVYFYGSVLALFLAIVGVAWHASSRSKTWRQALRDMLIGTGIFVVAGLLLPFLYRVPEEITLSFQGRTYAIPRVWNPYVTADQLVLEMCQATRDPRYESKGCTATSGIALSSAPILNAWAADFSLQEAGALHDGDRILALGGLKRGGDGWFGTTSGARHTTFRLDQDGRALEFRSCWVHLEGAPCDAALRISDGVVVMHLPQDRDPVIEASAFLRHLDEWRCPVAPGCMTER